MTECISSEEMLMALGFGFGVIYWAIFTIILFKA